MTVGQLIVCLENMPEDAEVLLMTQERWPFENTLKGICTRQDIEETNTEGLSAEEYRDHSQAANDVFLVEGQQLRYGNKEAWEACYV